MSARNLRAKGEAGEEGEDVSYTKCRKQGRRKAGEGRRERRSDGNKGGSALTGKRGGR
jgi:hypothetical protein